VLRLQHMKTIGIRELQQRASAAVRRVERGETLGITERGRLVAILAPPSAATGSGALLASGRVQAARRSPESLPAPTAATRRSADVLAELRGEN
jgi:antitoxin (DNA-binding transcriptional repressor) of toxin-antitoxin stability system